MRQLDAVADVGAVADAYRAHLSAGWARLAATFGSGVETRAAGCYVYDERDRPYLDCAGHGVYLLGHSHPRVVEAVCDQVRRRPLPARLFLDADLAEAAAAIAATTPAGLAAVHLTPSGAEAAELALKLARMHGRTRVVSTSGGFHGKTLGALSATADAAYREPFAPLLPATAQVPFGDAAALRDELRRAPERCVVLVEPVQGEGGVRIAPREYLGMVRDACDEHGALLVVDEVQTGLGRLGTWWASSDAGIGPDILLAGKVLGGGVVAAGALIATRAAYEPLSRDPLLHSSTFANSPLIAAAARATLAVLDEERLVERAAALGAELLERLRQAVAELCPGHIAEVRGRGLLLGLEWHRPQHAGLFALELFGRGVLVNLSLVGRRVSRLTPPAIMDRDDVELLIDAVRTALAAVAEDGA